jgi:hypothetical protein
MDLQKSNRTNTYQAKNHIRTIFVNPILSAGKNIKGHSLNENILFTGNNTGNIIFVESMKRQLSYTQEIWINPSKIQGDLGSQLSMVMPASNFIIHGADEFIVKCNDFLDKTRLPFTLAGLGAQLTRELNTPKKLVSQLSKARLRFFKHLSERATTIGVRGEITAQCLEEMGIYNYRIIGCPSYYKFLDGNYPTLRKPNLHNILITITSGSPSETEILEMGIRVNAKWIMQMMKELPEIPIEEKIVENDLIQERYPGLELSAMELHSYMIKNAFIFYKMSEWDNFIKKEDFTFAFGSRFHGNMCALRNGVPSLWITHDSRTQELVRTLRLPFISSQEFQQLRHVEELLQFCDYSMFYSHFSKMSKKYVQFLEENNLNHKFTLE